MNSQTLYGYFRDSFPGRLDRRLIGIENEYPAVLASGDGIPYAVVEALYQKLGEQGWQLERDGSTGKIVNALMPAKTVDDHHAFTHFVTTDAGFHTIEIGVAPVASLHEGVVQHQRIVDTVLRILEVYDATLLGYGIQPITEPTLALLTPRGRYRFLAEDFDRGIAFTNALELHSSPDGAYLGLIPYDYSIFTLSAAGQTHVDVAADEAIPLLNAMNLTSGLRIAIFANSPIWRGSRSRYKAIRELFWEWGWTVRNQQIGFAPHFQNLEHYLDNLLSYRGLMVARDGKYYQMDMSQTFGAFMYGDGQVMKSVDDQPRNVLPQHEDIHFQCGTAWYTARLQSQHGTFEDRCSCNQPPDGHYAANALVTGLAENHPRLIAFAERYPRDMWRNVRLAACRFGMQAEFPFVDVSELVEEYLAIAVEGLEMRGQGEEIFLVPALDRVRDARCPADDALEYFADGGIAHLIENFTMQRLLNG